MASVVGGRRRVFPVMRGSDVTVEATDSLGVPVVVISDGVEAIVVPSIGLSALIAAIRRAEVALDLDAVRPMARAGL